VYGSPASCSIIIKLDRSTHTRNSGSLISMTGLLTIYPKKLPVWFLSSSTFQGTHFELDIVAAIPEVDIL